MLLIFAGYDFLTGVIEIFIEFLRDIEINFRTCSCFYDCSCLDTGFQKPIQQLPVVVDALCAVLFCQTFTFVFVLLRVTVSLFWCLVAFLVDLCVLSYLGWEEKYS